MSTHSSKELPRIFLAQVMGGDSPIPYLFEKIAYHLKDRYRFTIMSDSRSPRIDHPNVEERYVGPVKSAKRLVNRVRTAWRSYDIVHTTADMRFNTLMAKLARSANRHVCHIHTFRLDEDPVNPNPRSQAMGAIANVLTAVSRHTAHSISEAIGREPQVIYNGIDTDLFRAGRRWSVELEAFGISAPYFLFIGSLEERKRPELLREVAREVPAAQFVLVGDGPLYRELAQAAADLPNLVLTGRLPKRTIPALMCHARALLFPSVREGFPNVVLEAMASGIPVIGVNATSMPEIVRHQETGLLAPPDDVRALRAHVRCLLDANEARRMGEAAREYVTRHHGFGVIAAEYGRLYDSILDREPS